MTRSTSTQRAVVRIERPASGGGVAHLEDGCVVFVRDALPGELVEVEIVQRTAKLARARARDVLEAHGQRVEPPCPYARAGTCGGCDLQHASTDLQGAWKSQVASEQIRRIAGLPVDGAMTEPATPARGSRTRLRCAVDGDGRLALRGWRSHRLVPLESCWLLDERAGAAFDVRWSGAREVELRAIGDEPPFAVVWPADGGAPWTADVSGKRVEPSRVAHVGVGGIDFRVSATSFWQAHVAAPVMLSERVARLSGVDAGDRVVDLFSGVGLFAAPLADLAGPDGRVIAVESSAGAVDDARHNLGARPQARVRLGAVDAARVTDTVREDDVVVVDPPRAGLGRRVAAALAYRRPRRVVYVSCDTATFARDLREFLVAGFGLDSLEILDLFPMTEHVELVALLDRAGSTVDSADEGRV